MLLNVNNKIHPCFLNNPFIISIMKNILLLSIMSLSLIASDDGNDLYVYGLSYHTNRDVKFHEVNPGLGVGHFWGEKDNDWIEMTVQGSEYRNSYGDWTTVGTFGPRVILGDRKELNVFFAVNAGFMYSVDYTNLVMIPSFGIGYNRFNVNFVFIPKSGNDNDVSNAIGMFLGVKF